MKIAFLTTLTNHHTWYLQELKKYYSDLMCISEEKFIVPKFETSHPFENKRESYEQDVFFSNEKVELKDICKTINVHDINQEEVISALDSFSPDVLISFGTSKIKEPIILRFAGKIVNLHGGDPENYRGLDSHLWAIYHSDWDNLTTTLHILNSELDDGEIIQKKSLDLSKVKDLYQLRTINTQACIELTISALNSYEKLGFFLKNKQKKKGRYYSFMPSSLKEVCVDKFYKHMEFK